MGKNTPGSAGRSCCSGKVCWGVCSWAQSGRGMGMDSVAVPHGSSLVSRAQSTQQMLLSGRELACNFIELIFILKFTYLYISSYIAD